MVRERVLGSGRKFRESLPRRQGEVFESVMCIVGLTFSNLKNTYFAHGFVPRISY